MDFASRRWLCRRASRWFGAQRYTERQKTVSENELRFAQDRLYYFREQEVIVQDFESSGIILDIGGGGEGIMGRLKGAQVVAIDSSKDELEGAPIGPLKVIMDARNMRFLDATFSAATSFFSLMYIQSFDHSRVMSEVFRVLIPGSRFFIWDAIIPHRLDERRDVAVFPITIDIKLETISAEYAVLWPNSILDLPYYENLAQSVGFEAVAQREAERFFSLELMKP